MLYAFQKKKKNKEEKTKSKPKPKKRQKLPQIDIDFYVNCTTRLTAHEKLNYIQLKWGKTYSIYFSKLQITSFYSNPEKISNNFHFHFQYFVKDFNSLKI